MTHVISAIAKMAKIAAIGLVTSFSPYSNGAPAKPYRFLLYSPLSSGAADQN